MTQVLIAYASKMGSTKEIADAIGVELLKLGVSADVRDVAGVTTLKGYDTVVLGSAVYAGRWRPEASRFVKRNAPGLAARRVWLFESGWIGKRPETITPSPFAAKWAGRIGAPPPTVFGGRLDPKLATGPIDRLLAKRMPGDARDWDEILAWARTLAAALTGDREEHR
ncbi:flavodoxin domain-containing protein [Actinokineospora xionganensis]|uniref:Flavodoxin domain-containing protein n=1 Tax=Actinokineospora xionganensis TaxID=2684470 RepID=A0ABR7L007_9PSEU|nr:flavodoxin domain-containing protein [Actinokineospora xionganensis]MBC6445853.1 flavodoxin domain-containing protein [Actinokineospora xionganensis]